MLLSNFKNVFLPLKKLKKHVKNSKVVKYELKAVKVATPCTVSATTNSVSQTMDIIGPSTTVYYILYKPETRKMKSLAGASTASL